MGASLDRSRYFDVGEAMSKVRVNTFCLSLEGYGAGPRQDLENPLGVGGHGVHTWIGETKAGRAMFGDTSRGGEAGIDNDYIVRGMEGLGAWILGRNMFGPIRGEWPDDAWRGWWGENPPYHTDVFVLTHHPRASFEMEGGTRFHFVTEGIHVALDRARASAKGADIRIGGGVSTVRQYLEARLIDELHLVISPVLLGSGEHLYAGLDLPSLGYVLEKSVTTKAVMHLELVRSSAR